MPPCRTLVFYFLHNPQKNDLTRKLTCDNGQAGNSRKRGLRNVIFKKTRIQAQKHANKKQVIKLKKNGAHTTGGIWWGSSHTIILAGESPTVKPNSAHLKNKVKVNVRVNVTNKTHKHTHTPPAKHPPATPLPSLNQPHTARDDHQIPNRRYSEQ